MSGLPPGFKLATRNLSCSPCPGLLRLERWTGRTITKEPLFCARSGAMWRPPLDELLEDQDWREAVGLEGGPFCYTDLERELPF